MASQSSEILQSTLVSVTAMSSLAAGANAGSGVVVFTLVSTQMVKMSALVNCAKPTIL